MITFNNTCATIGKFQEIVLNYHLFKKDPFVIIADTETICPMKSMDMH